MLVEDGIFGAGSLSTQLDRAYEDFQSFCRLKKIYCSQPPFTPGLDTCLIDCVMFEVLFVWYFRMFKVKSNFDYYIVKNLWVWNTSIGCWIQM